MNQCDIKSIDSWITFRFILSFSAGVNPWIFVLFTEWFQVNWNEIRKWQFFYFSSVSEVELKTFNVFHPNFLFNESQWFLFFNFSVLFPLVHYCSICLIFCMSRFVPSPKDLWPFNTNQNNRNASRHFDYLSINVKSKCNMQWNIHCILQMMVNTWWVMENRHWFYCIQITLYHVQYHNIDWKIVPIKPFVSLSLSPSFLSSFMSYFIHKLLLI